MIQEKLSPLGADEALLKAIRHILSERPSYGYRRVTAMLKHSVFSHLNRVNHKRVYRIMKENQLLLSPYGKRPTRTHDGKVITLRSNTRWCSDSFMVTCDNGDKLHVAFSMDTCDREILGYVVSDRGINGELIQDLMVQSLEYRFGGIKIPHPIQWLSDNGPAYVSRRTVNFGRELGFDICTTAPYSPESNGMAEAFVKTFKRDYVWFGDLNSAARLKEQLNYWFFDYNEHAPHKGLNMRSPRQFIRERKLA